MTVRISRILLAACLAVTPITAQTSPDEMPPEQTLRCPIGGQTVAAIPPDACPFAGQTLDGRPVTACDAPILLPDCTETGLPLYKTFDAREVAVLTPLLAGDAFAALRAESRFARAFWLERRLRPDGPHNLALFILLDAYRDDPAVADTPMMEQLEATATHMTVAQPEDPATLLALSNTAAWHAYAGRTEEARAWLDRLGVASAAARGAAFLTLESLRASATPDADAITNAERAYAAITDFSSYGEVLGECLDDLSREGCRADDPFKP